MITSYYQVHENIPFIDLSQFRQVKLIAASNNRVYLYTNKQSYYIAVKEIIVPLQHHQLIINRLLQQYQLQAKKCEFIIQIIGMTQSSFMRMSGQEELHIYICMEYMPYSLQDYIEHIQTNNKIQPQVLQSLMKSSIIVNAQLQLQYVIHGDIKPQNILIDQIEQPTSFKFCDFDNYMIVIKRSKLQNSLISTPSYHSPEINNAIQQGFDMFKYDPYKSQVYSLGLCLIQMHPQNSIKFDDNSFELFEKAFGFNIGQIIRGMLLNENECRPDFLDLVNQLNVIDLIQEGEFDFRQQQLSCTQQLVKSYQGSHFVQNTPDMYEILRRESRNLTLLESQVTVTEESQILQKSQQKLLSSDHLQQLLIQQQNCSQNKSHKRCGCFEMQAKKMFLILLIILLLIGGGIVTCLLLI